MDCRSDRSAGAGQRFSLVFALPAPAGGSGDQASRASIVIFALSTLLTGQFAFASAAID
jgi:hypothetical protein